MLFFHGVLTCFMLAVIWYDATRYLIPNALVALVLILYPAVVFGASEPVHWMQALLAGVIAFAIGFGLFSFRWMGGGDVKLLAACCVWTGGNTGVLVEFIFYTALLGGLLSILLWVGRPGVAWSCARMVNPPKLPRMLTIGEPVPYGLAIAGGFLLVLWMGKIPGLAY